MAGIDVLLRGNKVNDHQKKEWHFIYYFYYRLMVLYLIRNFPLAEHLINSVRSPIGTSGFTLTSFTSIFGSDYYRCPFSIV